MVTRIAVLVFSFLLANVAQAQVASASDGLQPGQFEWSVDPTTVQGPLVIVVSLTDQRAWVFRNGSRIATSTVSTGKAGKETPTGVFPILEKRAMHRSNLYNDAPMPFMQRLTWDGVALHAGRIPGHPASHGCVRLPEQFARQLFGLTRRDETVVVSPDGRTESLLAVGLPEWQARQVGQVDPFELPTDTSTAAESAETNAASEAEGPSFETGARSTVMAD